jgi:hypothetical protein
MPDYYKPLSIGKITSGIPKGTLVNKIIQFIYEQLPKWREDLNRPKDLSENRLNSQLAKFLDSRARDEFSVIQFTHQEQQTGHASSDISVGFSESTVLEARLYSIYEPVLVLEGKRLTAPSSYREREYLIGRDTNKSGGIQRFKLGIHGATLDVAAIIGYVQNNSTKYWHNTINDWISELCNVYQSDGCTWENTELLQDLVENHATGTAICHSKHTRNGAVISKNIHIHHLWILMGN